VGGVKCDSGQTPSHTRAAPGECEKPGARANRAGEQGWHISQGVARQFAQAGCAGKACGQGVVPLLATQLVDIVLPGDILAVVSTRGKAVARRSLGTPR